MGFFKKSAGSHVNGQLTSADSKLQAMVITAAQICDSVMKDTRKPSNLTSENWNNIWGSIFFGGVRYMNSPESIKLTVDMLKNSALEPELIQVVSEVDSNPQEIFFSQLSESDNAFIEELSRQIYQIGFSQALEDISKLNTIKIYNDLLPMFSHYLSELKKDYSLSDDDFALIIASSVSQSVRDIVSQAARYGVVETKRRYGASQIVFATAVLLYIQATRN